MLMISGIACYVDVPSKIQNIQNRWTMLCGAVIMQDARTVIHDVMLLYFTSDILTLNVFNHVLPRLQSSPLKWIALGPAFECPVQLG